MRLRLAIALTTTLPFTFACAPDVQLDAIGVQHGSLAELPGRICIIVASGSRRWPVQVASGTLKAESSCEIAHSERLEASSRFDEVSARLPALSDQEYRGSWAVSENGKLVAASFGSKNEARFTEHSLLIARAEDRAEVARIVKRTGEYQVALSWSPDAALLAVVYVTEQRQLCAGASVWASLAGHPTRCQTYRLEIFDAKGLPRGGLVIARNVLNGGAKVAWSR